MVIYTIVGFMVVWSILGSLLIVGAVSVLEFWQSSKPGQQLIKVAQVDLEMRKARRRMIAETLRQAEDRDIATAWGNHATSGTPKNRSKWSTT